MTSVMGLISLLRIEFKTKKTMLNKYMHRLGYIISLYHKQNTLREYLSKLRNYIS